LVQIILLQKSWNRWKQGSRKSECAEKKYLPLRLSFFFGKVIMVDRELRESGLWRPTKVKCLFFLPTSTFKGSSRTSFLIASPAYSIQGRGSIVISSRGIGHFDFQLRSRETKADGTWKEAAVVSIRIQNELRANAISLYMHLLDLNSVRLSFNYHVRLQVVHKESKPKTLPKVVESTLEAGVGQDYWWKDHKKLKRIRRYFESHWLRSDYCGSTVGAH